MRVVIVHFNCDIGLENRKISQCLQWLELGKSWASQLVTLDIFHHTSGTMCSIHKAGITFFIFASLVQHWSGRTVRQQQIHFMVLGAVQCVT